MRVVFSASGLRVRVPLFDGLRWRDRRVATSEDLFMPSLVDLPLANSAESGFGSLFIGDVSKHQMSRRYFDSWKFDFARACLTCAIYIALFALGLSQSFLYGGGLVGTWPLILAFFGGAWAAAWISCKLLPSQRHRMVPRLAGGIYGGYLLCWMLLGLIYSQLPNWPVGDPRSRFMARYDAALVVIPFSVFFILGPFAFSRWRSARRWKQDEGTVH